MLFSLLRENSPFFAFSPPFLAPVNPFLSIFYH
jgi:hypothetical protein